MNTDDRLNEEVEKTLRALDGVPLLRPNPFLTTRILARLSETAELAPAGISRRWRFRPIALAVVVVLNILTVLFAFTNNPSTSLREQLVSALSEEYGFGADNF